MNQNDYFFNQGLNSLLGSHAGQTQSMADYELQKYAQMQAQMQAAKQNIWQQPIQPPAPNPVLLLCGDEE